MAVVPADSDAWPVSGIRPRRRPGAGVGCRWCGCMVILAQVWKKSGVLRAAVSQLQVQYQDYPMTSIKTSTKTTTKATATLLFAHWHMCLS